MEKRKPVKCKTIDGIEFRCSYILSGYSLSNLSKQLTKYKCEKLVGDLDYKLVRHSETLIKENELKYCINDCMIIIYYIQELIERLGNITKIPLTKTGFVRRYCRDMCLYEGSHKKNTNKFHSYRNLMKNLTLDADTYRQLKRAFAGGFTHASALYSRDIIENVYSFDETSAYPYVMASEMFPMSKPETVHLNGQEDFRNNINKYCCLFDVEFHNIRPIIFYENYISKSKCFSLEGYEENNGRIVSAKKLSITITEQDYLIIREMYDWDDMIISNFRRFRKGYLPKDFVLSVLKLYKDKTELKGIEEKIVEYQVSKENVNACYGMLVTDICRDEISYDNDWESKKPDIEDAITSYNESIKRFLYYPWGVWVTAYARKNLFTAILELGEDYIYSDTDSVKFINLYKHQDYFEIYNSKCIEKLKRACIIQDIDFNMTCPKNIYGVTKQLGIWENETKKEPYKKFKTLGAKRYMVQESEDIKLTVSGLNKNITIPYMKKKFKDKIFENFDEELYIPPKYTGKNTHTYIDEEFDGYIEDYQGKIGYYSELSGVHLEETDYSLSLSDVYVNFLLGIKLREK